MRKVLHVLMGLTVALAGLGGLAPARARAAPTPGVLKVHVYDIGQGACVLVECPDDLPILIDCGKAGGGGGSIDTAGRKINAVLDGYDGPGGYLRPLRVILSHGDIDHYALLKRKDEHGKWLLNPERVRQVYYGGAFADYGDAGLWINKVHQTLSAPTKDYPPNRPCDDKTFRISCLAPNETAWGSVRGVSCGAAKIDLLSANAQAYYRAHRTDFPTKAWKTDGKKNADSAVVRVSYEGVSFIFPGDAQELTEKMILANAERAGQGLSGTGYLFGSHHGSDYDGSNHPDWIKALSPTHVVFSSNLGGGYGHPACAVVERYDITADASLTDASGAMPVRCGKAVQSQDFKNRFLVTEQTGDIEITVRAGRPPQMVCEKASPGCL